MSLETTEWAVQSIIFLGILLDGRSFTLGIPLEKRDHVVHLLNTFLDKRKARIKGLQVLCGYLNFLSKAIFPGRTFIRCMYAKFANVVTVNSSVNQEDDHRFAKRIKMKQHYHMRLDKEFKVDCRVWLDFLTNDERYVVNRPMVDILGDIRVTSTKIFFYSDASAAKHLGFGCLLGSKWIQSFWEPDFIQGQKPSIEFLELFALTAGVFTWQSDPILNNCRVTIFCDNMAVVQMINSMTSKCEQCMILIRKLVLNGLKHKRCLSAAYINTKVNFLSDALSCSQWKCFRTLGPHMNIKPDEICTEIWPIHKVWKYQ